MDTQGIYRTLQHMVDTMPDLGGTNRPLKNEAYQWLGRVSAILNTLEMTADAIHFNVAAQNLGSIALHAGNQAAIKAILFRALGTAEAMAPVAERGAFIPIAQPLDALVAFTKVVAAAKASLLFIDPYLDRRTLTDFAPQAAEGVEIRLLADSAYLKPGLAPTVAAWQEQHAHNRPLVAKVTPARALHDRVIIVDEVEAWAVSQSFEHLAARSPASITKMPDEIATLKLPFYTDLWVQSRPLQG